MADLVIISLPGRTGKYLAVQDGASTETIARFTRGEESAQKFVDWCVKAGINYEDTRRADGGPRQEP